MSQQLYQQVILEHNKKPRNYGNLSGHTHKAEGYNPLCGDHLWVEMIVDEETQVVQDIKFKGEGCAISKASASLMTVAIKGKSIADAEVVINEFKEMAKGDLNPEADGNSLGNLKIFSGIWKYPSRVKCAVLAWHAAAGALHEEASVSTEGES